MNIRKQGLYILWQIFNKKIKHSNTAHAQVSMQWVCRSNFVVGQLNGIAEFRVIT